MRRKPEYYSVVIEYEDGTELELKVCRTECLRLRQTRLFADDPIRAIKIKKE